MADIRMFVVGDVHISDQNPGRRTTTYKQDILTKLRECVQLAKEQKATHVLFLGDIFDNKEARKTSHRTVHEVALVLMSFNLPVYILIGNHDIQSGTLETLPKQPIGILNHLPNVTLLTHDELKIDDEVSLFPVPGIPLVRENDEWAKMFHIDSDAKRKIAVVHQLIVPDVTVYPLAAQASFYGAAEVAKHTGAHMILYGDVHTKHGSYKQGDIPFINMGSICRMKVDEVDHVPEVYILTIRDDERRSVAPLERFILKSVRPAVEVYSLEDYYEAKEHQADIDETIRRLKTTKIHKFSVDTVMEEIAKNATVDTPVRDKAIELIEAIR